MVAFRPLGEVALGWWHLSPFTPTLANFAGAWDNSACPLSMGIRNSLLVAVPSTFIPLMVGAFAGYGFARYRFPGRDYVFLSVVLLMAVPQQMVAVPIFKLMLSVGLLNQFLGLILLHSAWGIPWIVLFMRNFYRTLPQEVEEAARVDGASAFKTFYKIVLPMALPAFAAVVVLQFMWVWNDYFFAKIMLQRSDRAVATLCMTQLGGQFTRPWDLLSAAAILTLLVPVGLYVVLQRYYIRGMIGWTIKG
jgi:multiple sugar transport system permease protein